ncbi:MAG: hypothetical protein R2706_07130 [Acidimicrobiales bacterium]
MPPLSLAPRRVSATHQPDRRAAIAHAVSLASAGDVVLAAGSACETQQVITGTTVLPFDDRLVARDALDTSAWPSEKLLHDSLAHCRRYCVLTHRSGNTHPHRCAHSSKDRPADPEDGPQATRSRRGHPNDSGLTFVFGVGGYPSDLLFEGVFTRSGLLVVGAICAAALVGTRRRPDRVSRERNLGLNKRMKLVGLLTVAVAFAVLSATFTSTRSEIGFAGGASGGFQIGSVLWVLWAVLVILGSSNAVNLTDGLDGLAAGSGIFSFVAYGFIGFGFLPRRDSGHLPATPRP